MLQRPKKTILDSFCHILKYLIALERRDGDENVKILEIPCPRGLKRQFNGPFEALFVVLSNFGPSIVVFSDFGSPKKTIKGQKYQKFEFLSSQPRKNRLNSFLPIF